MTGIERLREVATRVEDGGCVSPGGECRRDSGVTCRSCLADELYGIAEQMESELVGHDADRARDGQGRYHTPSGQDESCRSAVARPACGAVPQEDRDAAAWVREHGGLDHVKAEWCSRVPYDMHEKRRRRLLGHIAECEAALGRRRVRIEELGHRVSDLTRENAELRKLGERVRCPQVLAADGEPLEQGQTVWHVTTGHEYIVMNCTNGGAHLSRDGRPAGYCRAAYLTHRRPVLDADGVPINVGDTVYEVGENYPPFVVGRLPEPGAYRSVRVVYPSGAFTFLDPERLTHTKPEPPDSWERIEEDALSFVEDNAGIPHDQDQMERDMLAILRRCKALAKRGE